MMHVVFSAPRTEPEKEKVQVIHGLHCSDSEAMLWARAKSPAILYTHFPEPRLILLCPVIFTLSKEFCYGVIKRYFK
jgi:hypothetical protein